MTKEIINNKTIEELRQEENPPNVKKVIQEALKQSVKAPKTNGTYTVNKLIKYIKSFNSNKKAGICIVVSKRGYLPNEPITGNKTANRYIPIKEVNKKTFNNSSLENILGLPKGSQEVQVFVTRNLSGKNIEYTAIFLKKDDKYGLTYKGKN